MTTNTKPATNGPNPTELLLMQKGPIMAGNTELVPPRTVRLAFRGQEGADAFETWWTTGGGAAFHTWLAASPQTEV